MKIKKINDFMSENLEVPVRCKSCKYKFNWLDIPESGMGYVKCPECEKPVMQDDV